MHPMFTAALFAIAKIWKQPTCPSLDEWIKKAVVHLYDGILPFATEWMALEGIMILKSNPSEKDK